MTKEYTLNDFQVIQQNEVQIDSLIKSFIEDDFEIKKAILSNPELVKKILNDNLKDELKADLAKRKVLLSYDYKALVDRFIDTCALKSPATAKTYKYALLDFEVWTESKGLYSPLDTSPAIVDDYIYELQSSGKSPATVRKYVGGLSSFFNFLERRSNCLIKNHWKGTKALPKKQPTKRIESEIPTENLKLFRKEIHTILANESNPELKVMMSLMAFRGLRAGSFQHMNFHGNKFFTKSKGKEINGELPQICLDTIQSCNVPKHYPFSHWSSAKVSSTFQYHIKKLYQDGKIRYQYSAHDLRHFYALTEYEKTKDIYNVSKLLGHSSIAVTEIYLRGLKVSL